MILNPIQYKINNQQPTLTVLPVIPTDSSQEVYGEINLSLPWDTTDSSSASVYKVDPPTSHEHRYIRTGSDLFNPNLLEYTVDWSVPGLAKVDFRFEPRDCTAVSGDFYSLEFNINNITPKVIVAIKDRLK